LSPRISFINKTGVLDTAQLGKLLKEKKDKCPRIVIFLGRMDDCGDVYEDVLQVCKIGIHYIHDALSFYAVNKSWFHISHYFICPNLKVRTCQLLVHMLPSKN